MEMYSFWNIFFKKLLIEELSCYLTSSGGIKTEEKRKREQK
jgi:hypothetical protein